MTRMRSEHAREINACAAGQPTSSDRGRGNMALLKYFKRDDTTLPNPEGPLSTIMPFSSIQALNKSVEPLLSASDKESGSRGPYEYFTEEDKAVIAKRACEVGVTNAIRALDTRYPGKSLKESTVRTWMTKYKKELAERRKSGKSLDITRLENKKMGRPLLGRVRPASFFSGDMLHSAARARCTRTYTERAVHVL